MSDPARERYAMSFSPRILVVDDEPAMCSSLRFLLERNQYEVATCLTGHDAIALLLKENFDIVILDIGLPDMDGYQVLDCVREKNPDTSVIIITGNASVESALAALRRGAYDYLKKPFESEQLFQTIKNALDRQELKRRRREAEKALNESEERFRQLVESSLTGISIIQDNRIVYQNPAQKTIFWPLSKSSKIRDMGFIHPEDAERVKRSYLSLLSGEVQALEMDFRFYPTNGKGSNGGMRWVQCRANRIKYQGKDSILLNTMDITRSKELERLVIIKNKMDSLGRVAAGIAHEIRNPLSGINSYVFTLKEIIESETLGPESIEKMREIIQKIQAGSNKIGLVIHRVMDFSKHSAPRKILMDINGILMDSLSLSAATMRKKGIKLETALFPGIPRCYADPHLMEQVILNLLNNAIGALEETAEFKRIKVTSGADDERVCLTVSDSGPGVPVELRERVFDPFFTTKNNGSGIGLNIVQRIVFDHDGVIKVGTSEWGGAEFRIELPISRQGQRNGKVYDLHCG